jgi:septum formation topological specificity factor MinE
MLYSTLSRPTTSAAIARQRLRSTLQLDRRATHDPRLDQQLLSTLLGADVPHASRQE